MPTTRSQKKFRNWERSHKINWETWSGLLFLSPWLLGFLLLKVVPILTSLRYSFTDFHMLHPGETTYVGLKNYIAILSDSRASYSLFGTISFGMVAIPVQLLVALGLAALLNNKAVKGRPLLRTLFFIPAIIPGIAIFSLWLGFLDPTTGWLNRLILVPLGMPPFTQSFSEAGMNMLRTLMTLWSVGPSMIIMLGAMSSVPEELYEAARVDGAGPFLRFIQVTIPMISPAILFSLVIGLISIFGGTLLLDPGNPFSGGLSIFDNYISEIMFSRYQMGYAAALAWVFFILMLGVVALLFKTASRWVYYPHADGEEDFMDDRCLTSC